MNTDAVMNAAKEDDYEDQQSQPYPHRVEPTFKAMLGARVRVKSSDQIGSTGLLKGWI